MAPRFQNGCIPDGALVTIKTGNNPEEGTWRHQMTPGTLSKWERLRERAYKRRGRWLEVSDGWGAYRPLAAQEYARQLYGDGAAWPGKSSHGGFWEGREVLAIDAGNWAEVYDGDRAAFYADARAEGFEPGLISPERGYPDEPWHIIDPDPWATPDNSMPAPTPLPEEDTMNYIKIQGKAGSRRGGLYAVLADGGGKFTAVYLGNVDAPGVPLVTDDAAITTLQKRISGLR